MQLFVNTDETLTNNERDAVGVSDRCVLLGSTNSLEIV